MDTVFIYSLNCPITGNPRYVGKTNNPMKRYHQHLHPKGKTHRADWVRSLLAAGREPILEILEEVAVEEWQALEAAYIQFFREEGCDLVNATSGGDGVEMTPEICEKISAALRDKPKSAEHRAALAGITRSLEACANISAALVGRTLSEDHCANISAANMGNKRCLGHVQSAEHRAKISAANMGNKRCLGYIHSRETKLKMSASGKVKIFSPEHRANLSAALRGNKNGGKKERQ